jgi:hypothetical protein
VGKALEDRVALLGFEGTGPGFTLNHFAFELMEDFLNVPDEHHFAPLRSAVAKLLRTAALDDGYVMGFFLSGPEENRTEVVQNRTGRRNKTGFVRADVAIDWSSALWKRSSSVARRIRLCWRATGAAGFAKGAFASGPRVGVMLSRGPNLAAIKPLGFMR